MNENLDILYTRHGGIIPLGVMASHSWTEIGAILHVIRDMQIDCIVELGVHRGGLGILLASYARWNKDVRYIGVEIDEKIIETPFLLSLQGNLRAKLIVGDVLSERVMETVKMDIGWAQRALIYCDDGNKAEEFGMYARILPVNGIMMVHDYPKEFNESHWQGILYMQRIEADYLKGNRQALFIKVAA